MSGRGIRRGHVLRYASWQHWQHIKASKEGTIHVIAYTPSTQVRNIVIEDAGHKNRRSLCCRLLGWKMVRYMVCCNTRKCSDLCLTRFNLIHNLGRSLGWMIWGDTLRALFVTPTRIEQLHWVIWLVAVLAGNRGAVTKELLWDCMRGQPTPCDCVSSRVLDSAKKPSYGTHCTKISLRIFSPLHILLRNWWVSNDMRTFSALHSACSDVCSDYFYWFLSPLWSAFLLFRWSSLFVSHHNHFTSFSHPKDPRTQQIVRNYLRTQYHLHILRTDILSRKRLP